jgi:hypothetical protein
MLLLARLLKLTLKCAEEFEESVAVTVGQWLAGEGEVILNEMQRIIMND